MCLFEPSDSKIYSTCGAGRCRSVATQQTPPYGSVLSFGASSDIIF
ncbi:hypothetical protein [Leptospira interrogans]|nr:hypothetical protein [Leptospira interrogans]